MYRSDLKVRNLWKLLLLGPMVFVVGWLVLTTWGAFLSFAEATDRAKCSRAISDIRELAEKHLAKSPDTWSILTTAPDVWGSDPEQDLYARYYDTDGGWLLFASRGPDKRFDISEFELGATQPAIVEMLPLSYNPTNGTVSRGDIIWFKSSEPPMSGFLHNYRVPMNDGPTTPTKRTTTDRRHR